MAKAIRDFAELKDFNEELTPKLSIATLCVSLRNIVLEFEAADDKIREILVSGGTDGPEIKIAIQTERDNRKAKLTVLLNEVYQARNLGQEKKMPEWKKASDVFKNITQGFKAKSEPKVEQMEKSIVELTSSIDTAKSELKHWSEETGKNLIRIKVLEDEKRSLVAKNTDEENVTSSMNIRESEKFMDSGFKLDAKTPCFKSGAGEDVETWLDKIETALVMANVHPSFWLAKVTNYVEGTAYEMLTAARKAHKPWSSFKTSLIATFRPIFKDFDLRNRINHLKDKGNFMEYLYEFRLLSNQVKPSDMSEKDRYMCFVQGLQPRTRAEIFMRNISDLEGAIEKATIIENARTMEKDEKSKVNIHDINILSLTSGGLRGKGEK